MNVNDTNTQNNDRNSISSDANVAPSAKSNGSWTAEKSIGKKPLIIMSHRYSSTLTGQNLEKNIHPFLREGESHKIIYSLAYVYINKCKRYLLWILTDQHKLVQWTRTVELWKINEYSSLPEIFHHGSLPCTSQNKRQTFAQYNWMCKDINGIPKLKKSYWNSAIDNNTTIYGGCQQIASTWIRIKCVARKYINTQWVTHSTKSEK